MFTVLEKIALIFITALGIYLTRVFLRLLYNHVLGPKLHLHSVKLSKMGKWAVVTGATDGVGKAYAEILAKKGLNLVLISRTQTKLEAVASEIETNYKVETKIIAADFTDENIYYDIEKQLLGLEIGVLINNVGMSYPHPEYFLDLPEKDTVYGNIIKCNILSVTNMCKIVMPIMVERHRGVVVNISSTAAQIPSPLLTVYAASKAYIKKFSEDLSTEYSKSGIIVQCILPGYVATKMSKIHSSTWMAPSPKKFATEAIKTIGVQEHTTGYFPHTLLVGVVKTLGAISPKLPRWIIMRTMLNIRSRALRRYIQ